MKKKLKKFALWLIPTVLIAFIATLFLETKITVIIMCLALIIEADIIFKEKLRKELLIALLFALIITSYYNYEYIDSNIKLGRINLYPLICWTAGLIILSEFYSGIKIKNKRTIIFAVYLIVLLALEYIFYHFLNVRINADYTGLFGFNVLHAPTNIKFFYILAGPIYLLITDYLQIKENKK